MKGYVQCYASAPQPIITKLTMGELSNLLPNNKKLFRSDNRYYNTQTRHLVSSLLQLSF